MTSIFEITDWSHVASFFIWTLAVCAIAKALFGSLPAAELQYRLSLRDAPRRQRMSRLNWEINNRARWDDDLVRRSPHAAKQALSEDDVESRRRELQKLTRTSFASRAFAYFMGCFACQTFWTAAAAFPITRSADDFAAWFFTAAACSAAAVGLASSFPLPGPPRHAASDRHSGCPRCGK